MNIDYSSFNYIRNHEAKFQYILDTQPAVRELRNQIQSLIDRSIFNGKLECTMIVNKNKVRFTPSIVNTHRSINFVRAYSGLWCKFVAEIEYMSVEIKGN